MPVRFPVVLLVFLAAASVAAQSPESVGTQQPSAAAPAAPAAEVGAAEAAIAKQDWKTAETSLAAWLTAHPDDARALFDAGYVADAEGRQDDAAGFYQRAIQVKPDSFECRLSYGLLLARRGKLDEARQQLQTATKLDPGDAGTAMKARAWRALAQADRQSDPGEASAALLEALKLTPETPGDTLLAAELAEATQQPDAAETAYKRVLASDPKNREARSGLAHLLLARKQYAEAETLLRSALVDSPDDPALTAELAAALAAQDKGEALPLLQKLHESHPEETNVTHMLAEVLAESGDAAGSDQIYAELLKQEPKDAGLLIAHGQNLIRLLKYPEAFQVFTQATELAPADPDGWSGLAFAASRTGRPSVTLHALTMRSKSLPENASTYFLWATSYDMLHDRKAAISYYHQFLEAAAGKFPDQEWQARQRLLLLEKKQ